VPQRKLGTGAFLTMLFRYTFQVSLRISESSEDSLTGDISPKGQGPLWICSRVALDQVLDLKVAIRGALPDERERVRLFVVELAHEFVLVSALLSQRPP